MPAIRFSEDTWKWFTIGSLILGFLILFRTLNPYSHSDDVTGYYDAGPRPWSEVLQTTFLPPRDSEKKHVYDRYRPFVRHFMPKVYYSLHFPPEAMLVLCWILNTALILGFAWGIRNTIQLGIPIPASSLWPFFLILWWSPPLFFTAHGQFYPFWYLGHCGLALGIWSDQKLLIKHPYFKKSAGALFAVLACLSHENAWLILIWFATWIAFLQITRRKPPLSFLLPVSIVILQIAVYRSIDSAREHDWTNRGHSLSHLKSNVLYSILATFDSLSEPFTRWFELGWLDVTPPTFPWAFGLTLFAIYWAYQSVQKPNLTFRFFIYSLAALALISLAPYFTIRGHRFIHYCAISSSALGILVLLCHSLKPKPNYLGIFPLLAAHMLLATHYVHSGNWIQGNIAYTKKFTDRVLSLPELQNCSHQNPCCLNISAKTWGRNEGVLNWNSTRASQKRVFFPADTHEIRCDRIIPID